MNGRARVLVAHQPAYLPWPGYLSRLTDVGQFVILDHVQYSGEWQHRNYVAGADGRRRMTVPVERRSGQPISEARVAGDDWRRRHWRTLEEAYGKAWSWPQWAPRLAAIYGQRWERLTDLNHALFRLLLDGFAIRVDLVRSSDLEPKGRKTQMLIDLCRITGSTTLRVGTGAISYLDLPALAKAGVGLEVASYNTRPYRRGSQPFVPGLSALDLLLHQGTEARRTLMEGSRTETWAGKEPAPW